MGSKVGPQLPRLLAVTPESRINSFLSSCLSSAPTSHPTACARAFARASAGGIRLHSRSQLINSRLHPLPRLTRLTLLCLNWGGGGHLPSPRSGPAWDSTSGALKRCSKLEPGSLPDGNLGSID